MVKYDYDKIRKQVAEYRKHGLTNTRIAMLLELSPKTVTRIAGPTPRTVIDLNTGLEKKKLFTIEDIQQMLCMRREEGMNNTEIAIIYKVRPQDIAAEIGPTPNWDFGRAQTGEMMREREIRRQEERWRKMKLERKMAEKRKAAAEEEWLAKRKFCEGCMYWRGESGMKTCDYLIMTGKIRTESCAKCTRKRVIRLR